MSEPQAQNIPIVDTISKDEAKISDTLIKSFWSIFNKLILLESASNSISKWFCRSF